jgi:hypothetical protein
MPVWKYNFYLIFSIDVMECRNYIVNALLNCTPMVWRLVTTIRKTPLASSATYYALLQKEILVTIILTSGV